MLALIARFVGREAEQSSSNQAFLRDQLAAMQHYLNQFPDDQGGARATEWIEQYARDYRKSWQRKHVSNWLKSQQCPDCPLARRQPTRHCEIHGRWLGLLNYYLADEISTREYVDKSLQLLHRHKSRLKKINAEHLSTADS